MDLIVYGSLMHPAEFAALAPRVAIPVWVRGYRRAFDQRPMWRGDGEPGRTVLAVRPDATARFNGVLLVGIRPGCVIGLDYRERGYLRTSVPARCLWPFETRRFPPLPCGISRYEMYVGRAVQRSPVRAPLAQYQALCRRASASWGGSFARWFEWTTGL